MTGGGTLASVRTLWRLVRKKPHRDPRRGRSEKRWQPSYNADIAVERHGIIVSQFLTKRPFPW